MRWQHRVFGSEMGPDVCRGQEGGKGEHAVYRGLEPQLELAFQSSLEGFRVACT